MLIYQSTPMALWKSLRGAETIRQKELASLSLLNHAGVGVALASLAMVPAQYVDLYLIPYWPYQLFNSHRQFVGMIIENFQQTLGLIILTFACQNLRSNTWGS